MNQKPRILVVDDDQQICDLLEGFLGKHGYQVFAAHDGVQMRRTLKEKTVDLIILDVMMPGEDGITLCRQIREKLVTPIIILSAMGDETDRIVGLKMGADDYLPKPFNPKELLARIEALLRRTRGTLSAEPTLKQMPKFRFLDWVLDCNKRHLIAPDGLTIPLSAGEYELLLTFIKHPQRVLSRDQLLDLTKEKEGTPFDRAIDVQVGRLRKKIERDIKNPQIIITVRGGGYEFTPKVEIL
ncbi:MAG: response regulator [Gammaproteobacteria bacterium]|jgi:two-component system OmpR family response regulator